MLQPFMQIVKSDVYSAYSVYARDKEFIFSPSAGCFCCLQWQDYVPSGQLQVLLAEVDVDLQIVWL